MQPSAARISRPNHKDKDNQTNQTSGVEGANTISSSGVEI